MTVRFALPLFAVTLIAAACGDDSSLENLGENVQATLVARATEGLEVPTLPATATPEPASAELESLKLSFQRIDSFLDFLLLRLAGSDDVSPGAIGDAEGLLESGWLESCCPAQWESAQEAVGDAGDTLSRVRSVFEEEGSSERLALVPGVESGLEELRGVIDALPDAATAEAAELFALAGQSAVESSIQALRDLDACCEPAPEDPAPTPTA